MADLLPKQRLLLGTAVKITAVLNVASVDTATITIKDPTMATKITAAMTHDVDRVYSYTYQSAASDVEGDYLITITLTSLGYTTVSQEVFVLYSQDMYVSIA